MDLGGRNNVRDAVYSNQMPMNPKQLRVINVQKTMKSGNEQMLFTGV